MDNFDKEEFWNGLGRLNGASLQQSQTISELAVVVSNLAGVLKQQAVVSQSHENRLDRAELTIEAILEDLKRHREGRA